MSTHDGRLIRAAMWLGTCGLLRSGEFAKKDKDSVVLRRSHLTFHTEAGAECPRDSPQVDYMKLFLPKSKTDPFRAGAQVVISNKNAISAMLTYLTTKFELITDQPLLRTSCGTPLTVSELVRTCSNNPVRSTQNSTSDTHLDEEGLLRCTLPANPTPSSRLWVAGAHSLSLAM